MTRPVSVILLFVVLLWSYGCKKKKNADPVAYTVYLQDMLQFATAGYDTSELKNVVLRRFAPDGTFTTLTDSVVYAPPANSWILPYPAKTNDSLRNSFFQIVSCRAAAYKPSDYEVFIPSSGSVYRISAVTFTGPDSALAASCCPVMYSCRGISYVLDGNPCSDESSFGFSRIVWLHK
jgi:hypothetical protein